MSGPPSSASGAAGARGSGVVVGAGRVLTNAHNLRGDEVTVPFADGRSETGRVAGVDADLDLAAIEVDTGDVEPVAWAPEAATATIGTAVIALANPGGRGLRVTPGFVSSAAGRFRGPRGRRIAGAHRAHRPPPPRLVRRPARRRRGPAARPQRRAPRGRPDPRRPRRRARWPAAPMRCGRASPAGARASASPSSRPRVARRLRRAVGLPERDGVLVRAVEDGSPADRAGLEDGDLIVAVDKRPLEGIDALYDALEAAGTDGELRAHRRARRGRARGDVRFGEPAEVA